MFGFVSMQSYSVLSAQKHKRGAKDTLRKGEQTETAPPYEREDEEPPQKIAPFLAKVSDRELGQQT